MAKADGLRFRERRFPRLGQQFATIVVTPSNRRSPIKIEGGPVEFNASLTDLVGYAFGIPPDQLSRDMPEG